MERKTFRESGEDVVQQSIGQPLVIQNASNLLTDKIKAERLATYSEQPSTHLSFDQRDKEHKYKYYVPNNLDEKTTASYTQIMDAIFESYSEMLKSLTDHVTKKSTITKAQQDALWKITIDNQVREAIRSVLPVATQSTVSIFGSAQAIKQLIINLKSDVLPESKEVGSVLEEELSKITPSFESESKQVDACARYRFNNSAAVELLANDICSRIIKPIPSTSINLLTLAFK